VIVVFWYANYSDLRDVKVIRRHKARQKEVGKVKACKTTEYYKSVPAAILGKGRAVLLSLGVPCRTSAGLPTFPF